MENTTNKKEFKLEQAFALWKATSKTGKQYFTGSDGNQKIMAFYNGKKKNPKEPDLRVYPVIDGNRAKEEIASLWLNNTKNGKQIFKGYYLKEKVVGFINKKENSKSPYVAVYFESDDQKEEPAKTEWEVVEKENAEFPF